ncbi:MAG: TRAP transporter substrate-binding protein [Stomatobaculum sp.]
MKKRIAAIALSTAMAVSLAACGGASGTATTAAPAETGAAAESGAAGESAAASEAVDTSKAAYTISIGHINAENDSWHLAALDFKEQVEKNSNGQIKVEVYPNSQLGSEIDMIQSILQQGGCDITFTGESMQTYSPDLGMIGMPYLIQSDEHMQAVLDGEVGKKLEGLMEESGMKVLGYFTRGPRYITSNKEIKSTADCQNLLIRTPQSPMTVAAFEALGAKPTPMALSEVFTSLQSGTIEAQENPFAMIQNQSFYEVQKYLIKTAHLRAWVYIAMGKAQFDALPADLQQVVLDAGKHCQEYEHQLFLENEEKFEKQLQEEGMTFVEVDQEEFADKMIAGVLPILTDSQKALYEEIEAANTQQ